jgi:hypothetical protein
MAFTIRCRIFPLDHALSMAEFSFEYAFEHSKTTFLGLIASACDSFLAMNIERNLLEVPVIKRAARACEKLKHSLVQGCQNYSSESGMQQESIAIEAVGSESCASQLPSVEDNQCPLRQPTGVAKIGIGIVLAIRCVHSLGTIHRDFSPPHLFAPLELESQNRGFAAIEILVRNIPASG